ncbi:hypothetical protein ROZALSC1DRAFT_30719, partial [Rozella allomycis CSF55]
MMSCNSIITSSKSSNPKLPKADVVVALSSFHQFNLTIGADTVQGEPTKDSVLFIAHNDTKLLQDPFVISLQTKSSKGRQGVAFAVFLQGKLISNSGDDIWLADSTSNNQIGNWTTDIDIFLPASWKIAEDCRLKALNTTPEGLELLKTGSPLKTLRKLAKNDNLSYIYTNGDCLTPVDAGFRFVVDPILYLKNVVKPIKCTPSRNQVISYFVLPLRRESVARHICKQYGASLAELWGSFEYDFI